MWQIYQPSAMINLLMLFIDFDDIFESSDFFRSFLLLWGNQNDLNWIELDDDIKRSYYYWDLFILAESVCGSTSQFIHICSKFAFLISIFIAEYLSHLNLFILQNSGFKMNETSHKKKLPQKHSSYQIDKVNLKLIQCLMQ